MGDTSPAVTLTSGLWLMTGVTCDVGSRGHGILNDGAFRQQRPSWLCEPLKRAHSTISVSGCDSLGRFKQDLVHAFKKLTLCEGWVNQGRLKPEDPDRASDSVGSDGGSRAGVGAGGGSGGGVHGMWGAPPQHSLRLHCQPCWP